MPDATILTDEQVEEIEARYKVAARGFQPYKEVGDSLRDIHALCQTVRAAWSNEVRLAKEVVELREQLAEAHANVESLSQIIFNNKHATLIRDKCVEKVRAALADERRKWANVPTEYELGQRAAFTYALSALESLTLDSVEQKQ